MRGLQKSPFYYPFWQTILHSVRSDNGLHGESIPKATLSTRPWEGEEGRETLDCPIPRAVDATVCSFGCHEINSGIKSSIRNDCTVVRTLPVC